MQKPYQFFDKKHQNFNALKKGNKKSVPLI